MSYQDFLRSTAAHSSSNRDTSLSSTSSVPRKPSNFSSKAQMTPPQSIHTSITPQSANHQLSTPKSTRTPIPASPLSRRASNTPSTPTSAPPQRRSLTQSQIDGSLKICLDLQHTAVRNHHKRPFAALLLGPDNSEILLRHFSISHVQHAECELARLAAIHFSQEYLWACTLVSTWEPCAMCAGTIYWSNIGRLVYGASEEALRNLTGGGNGENMTMSLPCRTVLKSGQKEVEVIGPVNGWEERVVEACREWWVEHTGGSSGNGNGTGVNGVRKGSLSTARSSSVVNLETVEDNSAMGTVDEDGEYKADLKIDWM